LRDRSSRPLSSASQTPQATCDAVEVLRRQRYIGAQIADALNALRHRWTYVFTTGGIGPDASDQLGA
jgi:hypothetical protein